MTIQSVFRRANQICNRELTRLEEAGLSIAMMYWGFMPTHYDNSMHRHSFFEACYVVDGEGAYIEQGKEYPLKKGTAFLSLPGVWHQIQSETGLTLVYAAFEVDEKHTWSPYLEAYRHLAEHGQPVVDGADEQPAGHLWDALISMFQTPKPALQPVLSHVSMSLMLSILSLHGTQQQDTPDAGTDATAAEENSLFRQVKLFIDDNLGEELTLSLVAGHLHISSRHLTRLFQANLSQSFVHYIQERRVRRASQLLLQSDLPVKDIASQCGFQSVHYFTRIFTRRLGVSPAKFRRSQFTEGRSGKEHFPPNMS